MAGRLVTHPASDILKAFALGTLDDPTAEAVMAHLDDCAACCQEVASLSGDDFFNRLRQAHGQNGTPLPEKSLAGLALGRDVQTTPQHGATASDAVPLPPLRDAPPELVNHPQYELLRELGRGGMGVVYLACNRRMDRLEVLKVMGPGVLGQPGAKERFEREIRSAARLNHPNIVTAYSVLPLANPLVLAMEYVPGDNLADVVQREGPLPVATARAYVRQVAQALQHAHERQMVHRDIKPHNLIVSRDGPGPVVKVLDFGLARATRDEGRRQPSPPSPHRERQLTEAGRVLGTPDYMAPEQTRDAAQADIRADIYSLGCTFYFLLTGRAPFAGLPLPEILEAHQGREPEPLDRVRPEVPAAVAAVVKKMMAKDPVRRYQTPAEVAAALEDRKRILLVGAAVATGALLLGAWAGFHQRGEIRPAEVAERPAATPPAENATLAPGSHNPQRQARANFGLDGWMVQGNELVHTDASSDNCLLIFGDPAWTNYDYSFDVVKTAGPYGVSAVFRATDLGNYLLFDLAGWHNRKYTIECFHHGRQRFVTMERAGAMATNREYHVLVRVRDNWFTCSLDGTVIYDVHDEALDRGGVGFRCWGASARIRHIQVRSPTGNVLWEGVPDLTAPAR